MIEREFISQKTKEFYIKKYVENKLRGVGISQIRLKKIPLGEKIIIHTSRPSLIVGSKGANIKDLTKHLKKEFKLENPQIEIVEVKDIFLDANVVAERIAGSLERFGSARFKGVGHKIMGNVLNSGALGVELIFSGKIPGARAKKWRFYQGYLKKCGDVATSGVLKAQRTALLKSGVIGIKVSIMPPNIVLPDNVTILDEPLQIVEELPLEKEITKLPKKKTTKKSPKTTVKKPTVKKKKVAEKKGAVKKTETPVLPVQEAIPETVLETAPEANNLPPKDTDENENNPEKATNEESGEEFQK
ncbi:30S ribosomal protein S3 [Candidatus Woesearchaeota archaeon CG10_big_fil_rev_8_21_14_0_10_36_11]|nr:MAG: 30S ribosomal protein S3 [Candidatus Woesearchaeota archaeon CG10_big_fil_rev_8_21_14_0_10_36_11]